jgi:hypothetical protein
MVGENCGEEETSGEGLCTEGMYIAWDFSKRFRQGVEVRQTAMFAR